MNSTNKKYIIIFAGIVIFLIIFAAVLFIQQSPQTQTVSLSHSSATNSSGNSTVANQKTKISEPSISLAPLGSNAKDATRQFYLYYISAPTNPLANGAFRTNPYLSPEFKNIIAGAYHNGNDSIFCPQNKETNIVVGKEQQVYFNNGYITEEVISEAPPGTKDLYDILLEQINNKWTIFDINCM